MTKTGTVPVLASPPSQDRKFIPVYENIKVVYSDTDDESAAVSNRPQAQAEDDEEEELRKLQAEMAM